MTKRLTLDRRRPQTIATSPKQHAREDTTTTAMMELCIMPFVVGCSSAADTVLTLPITCAIASDTSRFNPRLWRAACEQKQWTSFHIFPGEHAHGWLRLKNSIIYFVAYVLQLCRTFAHLAYYFINIFYDKCVKKAQLWYTAHILYV